MISDIGKYFSSGTAESAWINIRLTTLIPALINMALIFAVVIFFFMFIAGGIKWITSGGDKEGAKGAQGMLTAAVVGLVIIFSAWAIKSLVYNFFGLGSSTNGGGTSNQINDGLWGGTTCPSESVSCSEKLWQRSWCAGNIRCICGNDLKYHIMSEQKWCESELGNKQSKCQNGTRVLDSVGSKCPGDK